MATEGDKTKVVIEDEEGTLMGTFNVDPLTLDKLKRGDKETVARLLSAKTNAEGTESEDILSEGPEAEADVQGTTCSSSPSEPWTKHAEKMLLVLYQQMESSKHPTKNKWGSIASQMAKHNLNFSSERCRLKVKSLKEKHCRLQGRLSKSGGDNPQDPMEDDLVMAFSKQPDVNPVIIIDSGKQTKVTDTIIEDYDSDEPKKKKARCTDNGSSKKIKVTPKKTSVQEMICKEISKSDEAAERRHREKMETMQSLVAVLSKLVDKENS